MTAEFQFNPPGEGGGGSHSPSHSSKKMKINKPILYIGGALVIILFLVFKGKQNNAASQDVGQGIDQSTIGYPNNSVDYQAAMQNNSDLLQGSMEQKLNQFQAEMAADYGTQLQQISDKMDKVQGQMDDITAHPNPGNTTSPVPAGTTPAPSMPATTGTNKSTGKSSTQTNKPVTKPKPTPLPAKKPTISAAQSLINKIDGKNTKTNSIVDYLKSAGVGSSMADRKKIAATLGIKDYKGTAAQNTAMLKKLKSDGK